jgi:hypothetical protein
VVHWCSKQGVLRWTHQLLLWRTHPWPHRDGADPGIVEGESCRGAPIVVAIVIVGVTRAIVLAFPLALTLAFVTVVGVGGKRGRGRLRAWRFL